MLMNEKQLFEFWKKYIDRPIYRAVPISHLKDILKNGIQPGKDPYKEIHERIRKLSKIIDKLEKKGFVMKLDWGKIVSGSYAIKTTIMDFEEAYVDFTPSLDSANSYKKLRGGALVSTLTKITNQLLENKNLLTKNELAFIKNLGLWANEKTCDNIILKVIGSSKSFEDALILPWYKKKNRNKRRKRKHLKSCFGSFDNFMKIFGKDPSRYLDLVGADRFYLRIRKRMPASEIEVMK